MLKYIAIKENIFLNISRIFANILKNIVINKFFLKFLTQRNYKINNARNC